MKAISRVVALCAFIFALTSCDVLPELPRSNNVPPEVTALLAPSDGVAEMGLRPEFRWTIARDADGDDVTYTILCDTNDTPVTVLGTVTFSHLSAEGSLTGSYTPDHDLLADTTYRWCVTAEDGRGGKAHSPIWTLGTGHSYGGDVPFAQSLLSPENLATGVGLKPTLTWTPCIDPNGDPVVYYVLLGQGASPTTIITDPPLESTSLILSTALRENTRYFWSVWAMDLRGHVARSEVWSFTTGASEPSPAGGLIAYFPFNGSAADESGNGNDAIVHGASLTADRAGNPASAYDFDGTDYLDIPDAPQLNPGVITVTAWFKLHSFAGAYPPIVKKSGNGGSQMYGYALECHPNPQSAEGVYIGPSVGFNACLLSGWGPPTIWTSITLNDWHFAAGVFDGSAFRLYVDGELRVTASGTGSIAAAPNNLNIGRDPSNPYRMFDGIIDEVRLYDRALTAAEIAALFRS